MRYAHISEDGRKQTVREHLMAVAELSGKFASSFSAAEEGHATGCAHDIGKYSDEFEKRLHGGPKVDHSTAGAKELLKLIDIPGALCVAGHHGGLPDLGSKVDVDGKSLYARVKKQIPDYSEYVNEISIPLVPPDKKIPFRQKDIFEVAFYTRMLYSCLTDADFLDTEAFMSDKSITRGNFDSIEQLKDKLTEYIKRFSRPKNSLDFLRTKVLNTCIDFGKSRPRGVYSLTVPTGGGKTVSSLAMAINHAAANGAERIIYVIPYVNIIEQTADKFREIFGEENVLEHHSAAEISDYDDCGEDPVKRRLRLSTENWDAPIIVTTNVQFFESLYGSRVSKCRKLHNIANSVIVFDEAQMIPTDYLLPCVYAIAELTKHYNCTAVLCTATQPSLNPFFAERGVSVTEIYPDTKELFSSLKRTTLINAGELSCDELAERVRSESHVLVVSQTRKQAEELFSLLPEDGRFHLSTLMTPTDRRRIISEIRERLSLGLPCRVASTSLVEAGVDLDFDIVFRAEAGLDSILQAAGRCNREGRHSVEESIVYVYKPAGNTPKLIGKNIAIFHEIERGFEDLSSPEAVKSYFDGIHNLQKDSLDKKKIIDITNCGYNGSALPFGEISSRFKLIDNDTATVFVPENSDAAAIAEEFFSGNFSRKLFRSASKYCVNIYVNEYKNLLAEGQIIEISDNFAVLINENLYSLESGLNIHEASGDAFII